MAAAKDASWAFSSPGVPLAALPPEVKVCDICGSAGYEEFLAVCTQCNERVEHVYCMQALSDSVRPSWVCEGCQNRLHGEICEEQSERLEMPLSSQEQKQNEKCIHEQEREEVKEEPSTKIVPSEVSLMSVSAEGLLQVSARDVRAGCGTIACRLASFQDCVPTDLPSVKLPLRASKGLSRSNLSGTECVPSFLLPSRPKELHRNNGQLSNKVGLPPDKVKVTANAYNEHVRKQASLSASGPDTENSYQHSCRKFFQKSQADRTAEAGWKCDNNNYLQVPHMGSQSKILSGNQKDMVRIEDRKARQLANKEAEVMETTVHDKPILSGSNQHTPEMRQFKMMNAGTAEGPSNAFKSGGVLEAQRPPSDGLLGMWPRYCASQYPNPQGASRPSCGKNERQLQPHCFHQSPGRPWRTYGQQFVPLPQRIGYACGLNVSNGDYVPPQMKAIPHVKNLWRGCFNVSTNSNCSTVYSGIQAHPSNKADPKVWEAAVSLPGQLKMKELKRGLDNNTWPQRFLHSPPTSNNIGMFFFPVNMESHDSWYKPLADRLLAYDLVLRAESPLLYLLIFHSQLLRKPEQLWDGRHYLWGVFRTKKSNVIQGASMLQCPLGANNAASTNGNGDILDMDIDMVGGSDVQTSTAPGPSLLLPPLPPGSPPDKPLPPPTPPHNSFEDDVSLCFEGLPSAPPSPPPTPPQSLQETIFESSCDLIAVPKHKLAAQQDVCPANNILESLPGGKVKQPQPVPDGSDEICDSKKICLEVMNSDIFEICLDAAGSRRQDNCSVSLSKRPFEQAILSDSSADCQLRQSMSCGEPKNLRSQLYRHQK